jgi:hypothetical protein
MAPAHVATIPCGCRGPDRALPLSWGRDNRQGLSLREEKIALVCQVTFLKVACYSMDMVMF